MNTARPLPAPSGTRKVVSLDSYRPPYTAEQLIAEALRHMEGPAPSLDKALPYLPVTLELILEFILSEFDYRHNMRSNIAKACRLLAIHVNRFDEIIEEGIR